MFYKTTYFIFFYDVGLSICVYNESECKINYLFSVFSSILNFDMA
jgi:hypothetical protein